MIEKNAVRHSYDEIADTYATQRSENSPDTELLAQFLDTLSEPTRILDAGCGPGIPVLPRISAVTTAIGVDVSREQLRLAEENAPDALLLQSDMTDLPFDDGVFDAVIACWSLIHIPMDDHQAVIDEFARVLRPHGRLLVCEGTDEWIGDNPDWLESGVAMQWNIAGASATRAQLHNAGFIISNSWGVPEPLGSESDSDENDDLPWTFFAARLDT
ncbi:class I SAM-dependent methyltransferase [Halocatena marina]|uniref:Class I SAM-dependent methyltransferase n=1 Tax=Halocatena marina TaxID=2934937 RepID=A0ABD5YLC8_9EURY|nr:class I SAM-dependent methyltransferase [Halocatena marina]